MRPGVIVSIIGHVGAVMMTLLAWEANSSLPQSQGVIVPVEIVDVALESNVRALAEAVEEEGEEQADETAEGQPEPSPTPASTPPRQRPQRNNESDFDAFLRNYDKDRGQRQEEGETAERTQRSAGAGTGNSAAIEDRVAALNRRAMLRCWRMPADLPDPERLVVTLEFELDRNGNLRGQPRVISPRNYTFDPAMRTAVAAAERAVRSCDFTFFPTDPIVGDRYDAWDDLDFTFRVEQ